MINARMETVASKLPYRALIPKSSRRALWIADGYFEWLKPERRGEPPQPFFFQVDGGILFAFATRCPSSDCRPRPRPPRSTA